MFKNLVSTVIKIKGTIEIIPVKRSNIKIIKYNKTITDPKVIEYYDEYITRIIKNGGL